MRPPISDMPALKPAKGSLASKEHCVINMALLPVSLGERSQRVREQALSGVEGG